MKIIDTHCHVYPDRIADKAAVATQDFYGLPKGFTGSVGKLLEKGRAAGIGHFVINSIATTAHQVHAINSFIAASVRDGGGIFTGLGTLQQDLTDVDGAIDEILSLGLKGIKLHPDIQRFRLDDECVFAFFEAARGRLPFLLHCGDRRYDNSNPDRTEKLLKAFPDTPVIGAHLGGWSVWEDAVPALHRYENFIVDCSSCSHWLDDERMVRYIRTYGADRVMFGTDFPLWDPAEELRKIERLPLTDDEREKIFYRNAKELYRIDM